MSQKICQSCAMPMGEEKEVYGTNVDGSLNEDYCIYCYERGSYTSDCSMEEMIEFCIPHVVEATPGMTVEAAKNRMNEYFPSLKRWKLRDESI